MNTPTDIYTSTSMDGMQPIDQAKKAILHLLGRINEDPFIGFYLGLGTESFSLLTEAWASLGGGNVKLVRTRFVCPNAKDPKEDGASSLYGGCSEDIVEHMVSSDVEDFLEGMPNVDRMELLQSLTDRFCKRCGGDNKAWAGQCGCIRNQRRAA